MSVRRAVALVLVAAAAGGPGCATATNYLDAGPRFAGSYSVPTPPPHNPFKVISFNIKFGQRIARAVDLLGRHPGLRGADILALQEIGDDDAARIAHALHLNYVYYPAAVHPAAEGNFGNAILSRWPLVDDRKIVLPHASRFRSQRRAAVAATVLVGERRVRVYSVHLETPLGISGSQRRDQARAILEDATSGYDHVVVAGDFNSRGIAEMFEQAGFAWTTERVGSTLRFFQWDHVFVKGLRPRGPPAAGVVRDVRGASDHYPIWTALGFS